MRNKAAIELQPLSEYYYRRKGKKLQERGGNPWEQEIFEISAALPCKNRGELAARTAAEDGGAALCPPAGYGEKPEKPGQKVKTGVTERKMQVSFLTIAILHIDKALVSR